MAIYCLRLKYVSPSGCLALILSFELEIAVALANNTIGTRANIGGFGTRGKLPADDNLV
jgi:hypothetical protein